MLDTAANRTSHEKLTQDGDTATAPKVDLGFVVRLKGCVVEGLGLGFRWIVMYAWPSLVSSICRNTQPEPPWQNTHVSSLVSSYVLPQRY